MQLYHDGTNSYITNGTGILKIATETSGIAINIGHGTSEVTFGDNVTVTGDFTVNGTTTTINTTNLTVTDPLVKFGQGYTGTAYDEGFIVTRGNGSASNTANKGFIWDESADEFAAIACNTEDGTTAGNVTINSYADLQIDKLTAGSLDISGDADIDGTLEADAMTLNGTAITATATLSTGISNTNVPVFTSGVADDDFLRVAGTSIEGRSASEVLSDIGASAVAGSSSIVTTGALNSGSITSGFGAIDNGSSAITTTGVITGGTVEATTDTAAGDNAAIGYTSAEGLILTGQGSTSDVTIKNDADATVISIPTGTQTVQIDGTGTDDFLVIKTTEASANSAPDVVLYRLSSSPADDDFLGKFVFRGRNDNTQDVTYSQIVSQAIDVSDGSEDGKLFLQTKVAGSDKNHITMSSDGIVFDGNIGVNTAANLTGYVNLPESDYGEGFNWFSSATAGNRGGIGHYAYESRIYYGSSDNLTFVDGGPSGTERMRIAADGKVGIGTSAPTRTLTVIGSVGNQFVASQSQSNDTGKYGTYAGNHYHTAEQDVAGLVVHSNGSDNIVYLGGGVSELNAATTLAFHTAANDATTGGTERMKIGSDGNVIVKKTAAGGVTIGADSDTSNTSDTFLTIEGTSETHGSAVIQKGLAGNTTFYQNIAYHADTTTTQEVSRITGSGTNGFMMLVRVHTCGHTSSIGDGYDIKYYTWSGGSSTPTQVYSLGGGGNNPDITVTVPSANVLVVNVSAANTAGIYTYRGAVQVEYLVPNDFVNSTWVVS